MRSLLRIALVAAGVAGCAATAQEPGPAGQAAASPAGNTETAATLGDRAISLAEIDARWRAVNPSDHFAALQALYDGRRAALDGIIADALLEAEAAAQGTTPAELLVREAAARMRQVSEAEVLAFYNANRGQMQGRPFDVMQGAIRNFLQDQAEADARQAYVDDLRARGPDVAILLDAPRQEIALTEADPAIGNPEAQVTLVEFSDFECPFCAAAAPTLRQLRENYGDRIRLVWKDFPLTQIHPNAFRAAEAGRCAFEQGGFWDIHDVLFANQQALDDASLRAHAAAAGLDAAAFGACLDSARHVDAVRGGMDEGTLLGVTATPTIFINGRMLSGAQPYEVFARIIDEELARLTR